MPDRLRRVVILGFKGVGKLFCHALQMKHVYLLAK